MSIRLKVENADRLSNGGPVVFDAAARSFDIGREGRDWNLPDPDMFISGRHCEIRYDNGGYWLHDVSRNGTFVNGSSQRIGSPHHLANGDQLKIGRYIVSVAIGPAQHAGFDASRGTSATGQPVRHDPFFVGDAGQDRRSFEAPGRSQNRDAQPYRPAPEPGFANAPRRAGDPTTGGEFLRALAHGAGVSPDVFGQRTERELGTEIGAVLRKVVEELALLLKARAAAKVLAKTSHRTMVGAADNNPLKFLPSAEEILEAMFARRRPGYLDAKRSFEDAFGDLKTHELATYAAMQSALGRLLDDLSPQAVEKRLPASAFSSKKTRAWDAFVTIWETKEAAHENGMLDVFLAYFSEAYAKAARPK